MVICTTLTVTSAQNWKCLTSPYWRCELQSGPGGFVTEQECVNNCINSGGGVLGSISIISTVSVQIGEAKTISATCKDGNGNNMSCPQLYWSYDESKVSLSPSGSSVIITGVSVGTTTIRCYSGSIYSNYSTVIITSPGCTNPKYKCYGTPPTCISDNCDGTGTFPDANCGTGCGGGVQTWYCNTSTKVCSLQTGSGGYSTKALCDAACSGGGGEVDPCNKCDKDTQYCLFGTCYKKQDVYMVAGAAVLLMVLTKK